MDTLHDELVQEVLLRLSIKSLIQCRLVCRKLLDLTNDPYFSRIHSSRSLAAKPGIMVDNFVYNHQKSTFHSYYYFINRRNYTPTHSVFPVRLDLFPDVSEFCVAGSRNGLLCFIRHAPSLTSFVCNPFFRNFIMLPLHDHPHPRYAELLYRAVDFGFCPKTQSYKVLHVSKWRSILEPDFELPIEVYVYRLGEESWNCIDGHGIKNVVRDSGLACNVNGALHWVDRLSAAFLTVFDLEHDVFDEMPGPVTDNGRFSTGVVGNCLSVMNTRDNILEIWIMKEYWVSWVKCFVIDLAQLFDTTLSYRVLHFRMEERELLILHKERVLSYNSKEDSLIEVANFSGQNWWYIVLHSDTLVELE